MATPNTKKIPIGFVLSDKYRISGELGRGGMAAVYEAENVDIGKRVAIKVLAQELTSSAVVVERFLREARAAAAIRSPYICDVYDSGRLEDGRPFLVLELLEGESLYERMTQVRFIDIETTMTAMTQTCRGLTKAHAANIVHRDLKPENIFLTKDEDGSLLTKILDFGLAKFYAPMEAGSGKQARLTREGAVFGTPAYMSPEQVRGQGAVDSRADLWALGCIAYECLTGRTVWSTEQGVAMTFAQIANAPLPVPSEIRTDLPRSFDEWFHKALDRDIEQRFQTAKEFAQELAAAFKQGPPSFSAIHNLDGILTDEVREAGEALQKRTANPNVTTAPGPADENEVPVYLSEPPSGGGPPQVPAPDAAPASGPASGGGAAIAPVVPEPRKGRAGRLLLVPLVAAAVAGAGYWAYQEFGTATMQPVASSTPTPSASASAAPSVAAVPGAIDPDNPTGMPWRPSVAQAQKRIAAGELDEASQLLKAAFAAGGHGVPRTLLEHLETAKAGPEKGPCKLAGLGRPRSYDLVEEGVKVLASGAPDIAVGPSGPLFAWADARETNEHAFVVTLDASLRPMGTAVDVTPEGSAIGNPRLLPVGDRFVLSYWDNRGAEAGVHVRWLNQSGRIGGPPVRVSEDPHGSFWPSVAPGSDGFSVVWTKATEPNVEDLFMRQLSTELEPRGDAIRLTRFQPAAPSKSRARFPSASVVRDQLHVLFRLERDPKRLIYHLRAPMTEATKGIDTSAEPPPTGDVHVGELELVNNDKSNASNPGIVCSAEECFGVWTEEGSRGAWIAYLDPQNTTPIWRKKFTKSGARPGLGIAPDGSVLLAWYDRGRILAATATRDGVAEPSVIGRVSGDQPEPSVSAGLTPGEWYIAWLDYETGHLEPYAARITCSSQG